MMIGGERFKQSQPFVIFIVANRLFDKAYMYLHWKTLQISVFGRQKEYSKHGSTLFIEYLRIKIHHSFSMFGNRHTLVFNKTFQDNRHLQ